MPNLFLPNHPENQAAMAAYMRDQFDFLGVKSPERRQLTAPVQRLSKQLSSEELSQWLAFYYQQPYREYQYVAIDLALANVRRLTPEQVQWCVRQVTVKPWWDSVDAWRKVIATWTFQHSTLADFGALFLTADDLWLRRVGITLQLGRKGATDKDYLRRTIELNHADNAFFIQKAIGWALRDYAKTNPAWVTATLATVSLSKLAQREAQKYLKK